MDGRSGRGRPIENADATEAARPRGREGTKDHSLLTMHAVS